MYRRVLIGGVTAAAILGAGGTAMAMTGSGTTTGTPSSSSSSSSPTQPGAKGRAGRALLRHLSHGQIVTHGKDGYVAHDLINGTVTAVSTSSITVQASDKVSEMFAVNKDTKVRTRTKGNATDSSISAVHKGDHVLVAGTGAHAFTAKHIVDIKK